MSDKKLSEEFILGLFEGKKEKNIVEYIFEKLTEKEIIDKLIKLDGKGVKK